MARRVKLSEKILRDAEPLEGKSYQIFGKVPPRAVLPQQFFSSAMMLSMTLGSHCSSQELTDAAFPCPYVREKFLDAFDATVCEGLDPLLGAVVYPDHLAIIDVVGIGADNLDEFEVLADPLCDLIDGVDMGDLGHHAASTDLGACFCQFHGNNSCSRETGMSEMRAMTSASQAWGSMSLSFAVPIKV